MIMEAQSGGLAGDDSHSLKSEGSPSPAVIGGNTAPVKRVIQLTEPEDEEDYVEHIAPTDGTPEAKLSALQQNGPEHEEYFLENIVPTDESLEASFSHFIDWLQPRPQVQARSPHIVDIAPPSIQISISSRTRCLQLDPEAACFEQLKAEIQRGWLHTVTLDIYCGFETFHGGSGNAASKIRTKFGDFEIYDFYAKTRHTSLETSPHRMRDPNQEYPDAFPRCSIQNPGDPFCVSIAQKYTTLLSTYRYGTSYSNNKVLPRQLRFKVRPRAHRPIAIARRTRERQGWYIVQNQEQFERSGTL